MWLDPELSVVAAVALVWVDRRWAYGDSCARPFARRRLSTRRPALVAIRARNPWVRARLILLGWKVRFIALNLRRFFRGIRSVRRFAGARAKEGGKGTREALCCQ